jgi:hypothetical protein
MYSSHAPTILTTKFIHPLTYLYVGPEPSAKEKWILPRNDPVILQNNIINNCTEMSYTVLDLRYAIRSRRSAGFLIPAKTIFVPCGVT